MTEGVFEAKDNSLLDKKMCFAVVKAGFIIFRSFLYTVYIRATFSFHSNIIFIYTIFSKEL